MKVLCRNCGRMLNKADGRGNFHFSKHDNMELVDKCVFCICVKSLKLSSFDLEYYKYERGIY